MHTQIRQIFEESAREIRAELNRPERQMTSDEIRLELNQMRERTLAELATDLERLERRIAGLDLKAS